MTAAPGGGPLFLALTPYHAFLAAGLAYRHGAAGSTLVVVHEFDEHPALRHALASPAGPFETFAGLPGSRESQPLLQRVLRLAANRLRVARLAARRRPSAVYVFNDARPESQALLHWARTGPRRVRCVYVEDGNAVYAGTRLSYRPGGLDRLLRRALYGRWFREQESLGTAPALDELHVLFPELVRPDLARRSRVRLDAEDFRTPDMQRIARRYLERFGLDVEGIADRDLVLLPHSSAGSLEALPELWRRLLDRSPASRPPLVKYHPREAEPDYLGLAEGGAVVLPRNLGAEFLFAVPEAKPRSVAATPSSVLLTARWLLPDVEVRYLPAGSGALDAHMAAALAALEIPPLS